MRANCWGRASVGRVLALLAAAMLLAALGAAAAAASPFVYVSNFSGASVSQYDGAGGPLSALSPAAATTGSNPKSIALTPDAHYAYIPDFGDNAVSQFSVAADGTLSPLTPATVPAGGKPGGAAVSPDGKSLYVANQDDATVSQYTIGSDGTLAPKTPATVATGTTPSHVAVSSRGPSVYVTSSHDKTVSQYTIGAGGALAPKAIATVATDSEPVGLAVSPDGSSVYVANFVGGDVSQYSADIGGALGAKSTATVAAGSGPFSVAVTPDGANAYVSNESGNSISQYSIGAGGELTAKTPATVSTGATPTGLAVSPDGGSVYAANFGDNNVSQYTVGSDGTLTAKSTATVAAGSHPTEIAVASPAAGPGGPGPVPPSATTGDASAVTTSSATLLGIVNPHGEDTSYHFEYGKTTSYGALGSPTTTTEVGSDNDPHVAAADIGNLDQNTTYHFRVVAESAAGTTYGADRAFTTKPDEPPSVAAGRETQVRQTTAVLQGTVDSKGHSGATYRFVWGRASFDEYSSGSFAMANGPTQVQVAIANLVPGQTYHWALVATYQGRDYISQAQYTFAAYLSYMDGPRDFKVPPSQIGQTDAVINGVVNTRAEPTTVALKLQSSGAPDIVVSQPIPSGSCAPAAALCESLQTFSVHVTDLRPGTHYAVYPTLYNSDGTHGYVSGGGGFGGPLHADFDTQPAPPSVGSSALVVGDGATLPVHCPQGQGCQGEVKFEPLSTGAAARRTSSRVLGRGRFKIRGAQTKQVRVTLTKAGRLMLRGHRRLTVVATTTVRTPNGRQSAVTHRRVTLVAAARR